ncbi:acyl-CoA thioesterase domain-containing protein [Mycobacterium sp. NPDC004974]
MTSFFTLGSSGTLVPRDISISVWSAAQVGGYAVCGALAREIEKTTETAGFIPARLTVDLFSPVRTEPLIMRSTVIRRANRIIVTDATVIQDDEPRARATAIFLPVTQDPPGQLWHAEDPLPAPPHDGRPDHGPPLIHSDGQWSADFTAHNNADRKTIWQNFPPLLDDEPLTPFQNVALIGENTSLICNWGTAGPGYINTDMTLTLTRLPSDGGIGLRADDQLENEGIAVGTATVFDHHGPFGKSNITAISNARRQKHLT